MTKQRIAFIRMWSNPPISTSILQLMMKQFPEYEIDILDIEMLSKNRLDLLLTNPFFVLKEYGYDILRGKRKYKFAYFRTPYFFKKVKEILYDQISKKEYVFSFQLQSLIDASTPGLPHFVYTDHTHLANLNYPDFSSDQLFADEWIRMEKTIYENASLIFTWSSNISRSIIEQYGCEPQKVTCVYAGGNVQTPSRHLDIQRYEKKNILFVGKDWERKGGPELVEAFKLVLSSCPDAHLTIVGCTPNVDIPNCTIAGQVPLDKVSKYYENASVFCLPTKIEPFGIVFIEALSYKLPVIATSIGAIPDFVIDQQNGYLVRPGDVEGLAKVLIEAISDPEKCRRFGEKGYQLVEDRYRWDKVGARIRQHILSYLRREETKSLQLARSISLIRPSKAG